jgi:hypothetical protein
MKKTITTSNKLLTILLMCFIVAANSSLASAQRKMHVWPPKSQKYIQSEILAGINANIKIVDARVIAPDSKVKASFSQISSVITSAITQTYGNSFIDEQSDKKVEIILEAYEAVFYTGLWRATTRYIVRIGEAEKTIEQTSSRFNVTGSSAGKKALIQSFSSANLDLFDFLNKNLK